MTMKIVEQQNNEMKEKNKSIDAEANEKEEEKNQLKIKS